MASLMVNVPPCAIDAQTRITRSRSMPVELATAGSSRQRCEPESGEEAQARLVVAEDEADERLDRAAAAAWTGLAEQRTPIRPVVPGATYTLTSAVAR